ncbi:MAG: TAXI family TRAP transporter solute-binding subunit [bacterium]|nr:TAXI family TRAP transporter solute-binding subunit [bacterium]
MRGGNWRTLVGVALVVAVVGSAVAWYLNRDRLPTTIRIATASPGSLYHRFAEVLEPYLERQTGHPVELLVTGGSIENRRLLAAGHAHLAVMQAGMVELDEVAVVAPLYRELVHVIVKKGSGLATIRDLGGRQVSIGPEGSGTREISKVILRHYRVDVASLGESSRYFLDLVDDETLDAAIVSTGLLNPDLARVLGTGELDLLPIPDGEALAVRHAELIPATIPRGFYGEGPPLPPAAVPTVATTTVLVARKDVSDLLVRATQQALYENSIRRRIPTLMHRREAAQWDEFPTHPATQSFLQPFGGLEVLASFMESLAALKELLFALGAGLYLAWLQWRRIQQKREAAANQADKDRLDVFLDQTIAIEREQMHTSDPARLRSYLDQVTEIKLRALDELSREALRGDVNFSIFLQQCSNLIRKIQGKLEIELHGHA